MADGFGFPSYQQSVQPRAGEYIAQGLSNLGQSVGRGYAEIQQQIKKDEEASAFNDQIVQQARNLGKISDEDYAKYQRMSLDKQKGVVHGLIVDYTGDVAKRDMENRIQSAHANDLMAQAQYHRAMAESVSGLSGAGGTGTMPDQNQASPWYDPNGNQIPGYRVFNTRSATGRPIQRIVPVTEGQPEFLQTEQGTFQRKGKDWQMLDPTNVNIAQRNAARDKQKKDQEAAAAAGTQTGDGGIGGWMTGIYNKMFGSPTPQATPSPTPQAATDTATPATGGYIPGKRYSGMLYLGGDPNDAASWRQ